ncbi:MAG: hypothetical protein V2I62_04255 [Bacteroidales bacterium]|jgi:hypothetical protein|nr:hypothetical protein [Bacteroidales bacterium]
MGKIYVGQSALRFTLDTKIDLSAASNTKIYYRKPDGTEGSWAATVTETNKLYYDVADETIIDIAGEWRLWAYAEFDSGVVYGEAVIKTVYEKGY